MANRPPLMLTAEPWSDMEARRVRSHAQTQAKGTNSAEHRAHVNVVNQLNRLAPDLRRLSMAKSVNQVSREDHLKYRASQTDNMRGFAHSRYGQQRGDNRRNELLKLGPGFDSLLVDEGLMAKSHFGAFAKHAQQSGITDPWKAREAYQSTLPQPRMFRGLTVQEPLRPSNKVVSEQVIRQHGMAPLVTRTLQSNTDNIRRLVTNDGSLPDLNEVHDKNIEDVIHNRVVAGSRWENRPQIQAFTAQMSQRVPTGASRAQQKAVRDAKGVARTQRTAEIERIKKEVVSQSVSDFETARAVTVNPMYNPMATQGVHKIFEVRPKPLDIINPADYLGRSDGRLPAESVPGTIREAHHEQVVLSHITPSQVTAAHNHDLTPQPRHNMGRTPARRNSFSGTASAPLVQGGGRARSYSGVK